jgi:hypothetical protein
VREITGPDDCDLEAVRAVYHTTFADPRISVPAEVLGEDLASGGLRADFDRHLWSVRAEPGSPVGGMVSFFTFPGAGFGGYLVLGPELQGRGLLRLLLARVE